MTDHVTVGCFVYVKFSSAAAHRAAILLDAAEYRCPAGAISLLTPASPITFLFP